MKLIYFFLLLALPFGVCGQTMQEPVLSDKTGDQHFKLYPNPAFTDIIYIKTKVNAGKDITIYDVFGKVVLRQRITTNSLDISKLVAGVYVLKVEELDKTMTRKLIVK